MGKIVIIISLLLLCGCSTVGTMPTAVHSCTPNLTVDGNLFTGTVYKCSKEYSGISKAKAFDKILSSMATNGYHINNSNKEIGLISAGLPVIGGQGQTVPMNVIINEGENKTIKVDSTINLPGGLVAGGDETANYFCSVYKTLSENSPSASQVEEKVKPTRAPSEKLSSASQVEEKVKPTQAPSELPSASQVGKSLVVIKTASIRSEPNTKSKIITNLKKGTKVEYLGKSGDWLNIKLSTGVTGWVFNSLVTEGK